ncbi:MAG TPA: beta-ketoacyl-[acyl-carrier-protein] synthase family protein [Candidatus Methylomirabilis sp.]|nr:beta-ketoacyl-[acyl-carrier-protein] synthase family protein [Candidatus Methylomirabilis sp.]
MRGPRRVVITGLGVVSPIGIGKDAFWESLVAGKSGVDYVRAFDASQYACKVAGEVKDFRPADLVGHRRAKIMGRFSQFALGATRLALDDAKLAIPPALSSMVGICYGTSVAGLELVFAGFPDFLKGGAAAVKPWTALEYPPHAPPSYLAIEFGIKGPALSVSSNCCTGIDALSYGFHQISSGRVTVALAGACDAPIFPEIFASFCALGALTKREDDPARASRPYDLLRDGLVLAEAGGTLVLEELDFARDRGAHIYAEVLGCSSGSEAVGMRKGDPSGTVMADAIRAAITHASIAPHDIDHINAHGSSLPDYDICDTRAFKHALEHHAYNIPITSIKSMIGQPVSVAGILQAAAGCLSIQHQLVPPTINQDVPDPQCDLDYVPNRSRYARIRNVLVNGHSFGGSVAALVLGHVRD